MDKVKLTNYKTCSNCLNAYNSPYYNLPQCYNKEWLNEGTDLDNSVRSNESCGTWQLRSNNQSSVIFPRVIQLDLFI